MSPTVKLTKGPDFAFGARWALMQYHPWRERREFLDMSDEDVKQYFRAWRQRPECPWYVKEQYLSENGRSFQGGASPVAGGKSSGARASALSEAEYEARLQELLAAEDFEAAAALQRQQQGDAGREDAAGQGDGSEGNGDDGQGEEAQESTDTESDGKREETRILRMLYQGNVAETSRQEEVTRMLKVFNRRHGFYKKTWVTSLAQETARVHPGAGAMNVYEDSSDQDAYMGEQREIQREMEELRRVKDWINLDGCDAAAEARAVSSATGQELDLRLDWGEVRKKLASGAGSEVSAVGGEASCGGTL